MIYNLVLLAYICGLLLILNDIYVSCEEWWMCFIIYVIICEYCWDLNSEHLILELANNSTLLFNGVVSH